MKQVTVGFLAIICLIICLSCDKRGNAESSKSVSVSPAEAAKTAQLIRDAYATQKDINSPAINVLKRMISDDLNSESNNKIIVESINRREQVQYSRKDVTINLRDITLHNTDSSGMPQVFIIVKCFIKGTGQIIGKEFNPRGDILRTYIDHDKVDMLFGPFDLEEHVFKVWGTFNNGAEPDLRFIDLRKNGPEYILLGEKDPGEPACEDCDPPERVDAVVIGYDPKGKKYNELLRIQSYLFVATSGPTYRQWSNIKWSDWINKQYRALIVTTLRLGDKTEFTERADIYTLNDQQSLNLAARIDDGKVVLNNNADSKLLELRPFEDEFSKVTPSIQN